MVKVIQWASGNVGMASLRSILARPNFELVGCFVYNPEKAGKDAGEVAGKAKVGVLTTSDPEEILALEADCVVFNPLGDRVAPVESEEHICRLLASGKNVVSTAITPHIHPEAMSPETRARIEEACRQGNTSFFSTGVNPGFTFDILPITLSQVSDRIDHIHCVELVDMSTYSSSTVAHGMIGLGKRPEEKSAVGLGTSSKDHAFYVSARIIEDACGIAFDDVEVTMQTAVTDKPVVCTWGTVEAGTVAALRMRMQAFVKGTARCTWDLIWRVTDDVAPDWPKGKSSWEVHVEGDPAMSCRFDMKAQDQRTTSLLTSMAGVNAIEAVVAAAPGIRTRLDLPFFAGGRFAV
jgi:hypothetical protein